MQQQSYEEQQEETEKLSAESSQIHKVVLELQSEIQELKILLKK